MIFHFTIFVWALIFSSGLWLVSLLFGSVELSWSRYLFSIAGLFFISMLAVRRITHKSINVVVPALLSITAPILLSLIDAPTERQVFVGIVGGMYYLSLLALYRLHHARIDQTAQSMLAVAVMASLFFFYSGVYGFYVNFNFPLWGLMVLFCVGTTVASYQTFIHRERHDRKRVILYSLILGLVMGECAWVFGFWPFGYLTTGAIALILFFLLWDIAFTGFYGELSLRKTLLRTMFSLILVSLLLLSTPWNILA